MAVAVVAYFRGLVPKTQISCGFYAPLRDHPPCTYSLSFSIAQLLCTSFLGLGEHMQRATTAYHPP
jgi:hypothetical protein